MPGGGLARDLFENIRFPAVVDSVVVVGAILADAAGFVELHVGLLGEGDPELVGMIGTVALETIGVDAPAGGPRGAETVAEDGELAVNRHVYQRAAADEAHGPGAVAVVGEHVVDRGGRMLGDFAEGGKEVAIVDVSLVD